MKKIGLIVKETSQSRIKQGLKNSSATLVINYSSISSPDLSSLRRDLKGVEANLFVVKNTVAHRVFAETGLQELVGTIEGPCGIIFTKDEPVEASRVLYNFLKDHEQLKIKGGILKDKILEREDIESMAKLPSKLQLRARLVGTLNAPIQGLATVLSQTLSKLVICLEQIKTKRQKNAEDVKPVT